MGQSQLERGKKKQWVSPGRLQDPEPSSRVKASWVKERGKKKQWVSPGRLQGPKPSWVKASWRGAKRNSGLVQAVCKARSHLGSKPAGEGQKETVG